jgi:hypothetical protein
MCCMQSVKQFSMVRFEVAMKAPQMVGSMN